MPFIRWWASVANVRPKTSPKPTVIVANRIVTHRLCRNSAELRTSAYCSNPT
jgi:hypothetical protein